VEPASTPSVCLRGPLHAPPFPSSNFSFGGNPGMCQDGTADRGPLMKALAPTSPGRWLDANRISLYGWDEPGFEHALETNEVGTRYGYAPIWRQPVLKAFRDNRTYNPSWAVAMHNSFFIRKSSIKRKNIYIPKRNATNSSMLNAIAPRLRPQLKQCELRTSFRNI